MIALSAMQFDSVGVGADNASLGITTLGIATFGSATIVSDTVISAKAGIEKVIVPATIIMLVITLESKASCIMVNSLL